MEHLFDTVLTVEIGLTAVLAGGIQETIKRALKSYDGRWTKGPGFSTAQAFLPLILGALLGHVVIPDDGVTDSWILGMLAGLFSSQAYNMVAPYAKSMLERSADGHQD